jgi:GNAT superfamily N-acetyltransferase
MSSEQENVDTDQFEITMDKARLDIDAIHDFLSNESYWARERTIEQTRVAIDNSICYGVYTGERQIGFARVVTDRATFAYIGDVYILEEFRGCGLSKRLMQTIIDHPELQNLRRWVLATRDAHGLYEQYGFTQLKFPERWMERAAVGAY